MKRPPRGFTLVELLIVIAVIAVLATIGIIAYNNIQRNARNAGRIATASQLRTVVLGVMAKTDITPALAPIASSPGELRRSACLSRDLPDSNSDGNGDCVVGQSGSPVIVSEKPAFNALFESIASVPSANSFPPVTTPDDDNIRAPFIYQGQINNTGPDQTFLEYHLEGGDQDCRMSPLVRYAWQYDYFSDLQGKKNSGYYPTNSNATLCIVHLKTN